MYKKWKEIFSLCPLFQGINADELNIMFGCFKPRTARFRKNDCIAIAGERFNGIGVLLSGEVAVTKENAAGNRMILTVLSSGEIFGEMAAFSKFKVWPATIIAQKESIVLFLSSESIVGECEKRCAWHKRLVLNMLRILSDKALTLNKKLEYLSIKSMRGKISAFLLEQFKKTGQEVFIMPLKRSELADFLNVTRPALSREFCRMRDDGIIEFYRSSVKIKDIEELQNAIE
ncbi:MAG: Crp/Fnr family transcriptional regulator [Desulfitobacteriaceae bacterium]|nr:Crp/Fnr family transcriptional regulator [Desulfitobacteriaceae bacterium]MDD4753091.1 Crp/Fnr family transcriptional regulator [Desulfitobacteriaceae bacterium]